MDNRGVILFVNCMCEKSPNCFSIFVRKRTMKIRLAILFCLLVAEVSLAQKENNNWYFGYMASVNFNAGYPQSMANSQMDAFEGCATISSPDGKLLFYTDGLNVWDSTHNLAMNGTGLNGNMSSTQSAIIVPRPGMPGRYYIFTVTNEANTDGLCYSEYDMSLNGNKGGVINGSKNILLLTPTCEKIAAIHSDNGVDYWLMTHKWNSDSIFAWKITSSGISLTPVISRTGFRIDGMTSNTLGYMKFSPDGTKVAYTTYSLGQSVIADFNTSTGVVSNVWTFPNFMAYGIDFSSNGNFLYIAEMYTKSIYQYDAKAASDALFASSKTLVDNSIVEPIGAMQLAPDKKIYISSYGSTYLHAVNAPNFKGSACGFKRSAVYLGGYSCKYGLPTFIQASPLQNEFLVQKRCFEDTATFIPIFKSGRDSVFWDFGEPSSGAANYSRTKGATHHVYARMGRYHATMVVYKTGKADTVGMDLDIYRRDSTFKKVKVCENDSFFSGKNYYKDPGTYTEKLLNRWGCDSLFTFELEVTPAIHFNQALVLCAGHPVKVGNHSYSVAGTYFDTLKRQAGCDSIIETRITGEKLVSEFEVDSSFSPVFQFLNKSAGDSLRSCYWYLDSAGPLGTGKDYTSPRLRVGRHKVCLLAESSSRCRDTSCVDLYIAGKHMKLYNVFTPNGDDINDVFEFTDVTDLVYDLLIYDRWGVLVYEVKHGNTAVRASFWNGKLMNTGAECADGTYYFLLALPGEERQIEGTVQLIR